MPNKISNIAKNTSYFTLALILQKIIAFIFFTLMARHLAPEDLGKFYLAISLTTMFAIFIDIGLSNVLVREVAKAGEGSRLLGTVISIKLPLSIVTIAAVIIAANFLGYPEIVKQLVYISTIAMTLDSFTLSFYAVTRGHHNLKWESIGSVIFQAIVLVFGLTALKTGANLKVLMSVMAGASLFNFLYSFAVLKYKLKISARPVFDRKLQLLILKIAWPFAVFAILQRLFTYLDTVLLSLLADERSVGLYQVAFKIIYALQFLPMAFTASLYPAFAAYWRDAVGALRAMPLRPSQLTVTFERAMNYLSIVSLPVAAGGIILGDKIIAIFKPEYADALLPLQITLLALVFMFLNFPLGSLMNACDRQSTNTLIMGLGLAFSIAMNAVLIPRSGAVGAAITVVTANAFMFALSLVWARGITPYRLSKIFGVFGKSLAAALVMAALAWYLKGFFSIILVIPVAGAVYFAVLYMLKVVRREDIKSILSSFIR